MPEKLEYLHASLPDVIILIIVALCVASVFYFISKRSSPKIIDCVVRISRNITVIYIVQWALILSLTYVNQFLQVEANLLIAIAVLLLIMVASIILGEVYARIKRNLLKQ